MSRSGRAPRVLLAVALAGVAMAAYGQAVLGADALDTDRATVILMARDFAQGHFSVFFWQQNYMAALEPLLLTPLALLGLLTPVSTALVAVGVTALIAALSLRLAERVGGALWLVALLWALPPAVVVHHHVALYGARLVATLIALWGFSLALRARRPGEVVAVGVLVGAAYLGDHLMISWAVGTFYVLARRGHLRPVAWGAAPIVLFDGVAALFSPTVHLSGPNDPGDWLHNPIQLVTETLPQLFGFIFSRGPTPVFEEVPSLLPPGGAWLLVGIPAATVLALSVGTLLRRGGELLGRGRVGTGVRSADPGRGQSDTDPEEVGILLGGLVLTCLMACGIYTFVGGGGDVWPARYLVPLWPAVTVLLGAAVAGWHPRRRALAALVVLPALHTHLADPTWPQRADAEQARTEAEAVRGALRASGVAAVWTDYWDTYRLALLVGEDLPWATVRMLDRRPDWTAAAEAAAPVAYLIRPNDREILRLIEDQPPASPSPVLEQRTVGPYRYFVTSTSVPGVSGAQGSPPPVRFAAASLGPLLLFAGALLVVGLAVPRLFPEPYQVSTHHPDG